MLPTETVPIDDDPTRFSDLESHRSNTIPCPFCGDSAITHETGEEPEHHIHTTLSDEPICRRLYECGDKTFYAYKSLGDEKIWIATIVKQGLTEKVDDPEEMVVGIGHKKATLKPAWRFRTKDATKEDFTPYLRGNLIFGLELEYDFKTPSNPPSESVIQDVYGIEPTAYHHPPACPVCGKIECWNHLPENLIRSIEKDSSVNGWEFIIYGSNLDSETFLRRLPMAKLKRYFNPTQHDSLHVHAMLVHNIVRLPTVIAKNLWQLFRFYYPAIVNLFGNYSAEQGFLRISEHDGQSYAHFPLYKRSPYSMGWANGLNEHDNNTSRAGLYFCKTPIARPYLDSFDVEIRTPDSTFDAEQIVMARALTKALILRAAQLSNFGLISIETNKEMWEKVRAIIVKLEARKPIGSDDEAFMRDLTVKLMKEVSPFLSEFERICMIHLIETPVRHRDPSHQTTESVLPPTSATAKQVHRIIALANIESTSEADWISQVASLMGITSDKVTKALAELKVYYDSATHNMVING